MSNLDTIFNLDAIVNYFGPFINTNKINPQSGIFSIDLIFLIFISVLFVPYIFYNLKDKLPHPVKTNLHP